MNTSLSLICSIVGHRNVFNQLIVRQKLFDCLDSQIKSGCNIFYVGVHGDFDSLALSVLKELRRTRYPDIEINVVFTSLHSLVRKDDSSSTVDMYDDVNTTFFPVEEEFYLNKITKTNQLMIDKSDVIIFFVNETYYQSGAKKALKYARRKNKNIINLY